MKTIEIEIPEGKEATWVNGVLTLVDEEKPKNVMERIKTFEDALSELGDKNALVQAYHAWKIGGVGNQADIDAYLKLRIIAVALNEDPGFIQFTKDEWRYFPYFRFYTKEELEKMSDEEKSCVVCREYGSVNAYGGGSYVGTFHDVSGSSAYIGSRLSLKTKELATYSGHQFIDIWVDYLIK